MVEIEARWGGSGVREMEEKPDTRWTCGGGSQESCHKKAFTGLNCGGNRDAVEGVGL